MKGYPKLINEILADNHLGEFDAGEIEEWMRIGHPTLDGLSRKIFEHEVLIAARCIIESREIANQQDQ